MYRTQAAFDETPPAAFDNMFRSFINIEHLRDTGNMTADSNGASLSLKEEQLQYPSFSPMLLDNKRNWDDATDFQSNRAGPMKSFFFDRSPAPKALTGLGIDMGNFHLEGSFSRVERSHSLAMLSDVDSPPIAVLPDSSPIVLSLTDPFQEEGYEETYRISGGLTQTELLKALDGNLFTPNNFWTPEMPSEVKLEGVSPAPAERFKAMFEEDRPPSTSSIFADINMFSWESEGSSSGYVKPEDLSRLDRPALKSKKRPRAAEDAPRERRNAPYTAPALPLARPRTGQIRLPTGRFARPVNRSESPVQNPTLPDTHSFPQLSRRSITLQHQPKSSLILNDRANVACPSRSIQAVKCEVPDIDDSSALGDIVRQVLEQIVSPFMQDSASSRPDLTQEPVQKNVHRDILQKDMLEAVQGYRATHPTEKLPESLLFSFAGRLSLTGETIPGYRCYVKGCTKVTKRKDHMADHIRTHVGERPYQCKTCGQDFIRLNDCLRHETNHLPDKKFVCTCSAAFSRRDLFVRHQRLACTLRGEGTNMRPGKKTHLPTDRENLVPARPLQGLGLSFPGQEANIQPA